MDYKVSCPNCRKRVSRWCIFFEPVIYDRCRSCGVQFRTYWTGTFIVVTVELLWFVLERMHVISPYLALALICGYLWSGDLASAILYTRATQTTGSDEKRMTLTWPNNRPGVDAGLTPVFAFERHRPGTTQAERWAATAEDYAQKS